MGYKEESQDNTCVSIFLSFKDTFLKNYCYREEKQDCLCRSKTSGIIYWVEEYAKGNCRIPHQLEELDNVRWNMEGWDLHIEAFITNKAFRETLVERVGES